MLRRQKHVLSQSTTPFACTLVHENSLEFIFRNVQVFGDRQSQLSGNQFDKTTARYDYCVVLSHPPVYFNREFPRAQGVWFRVGTMEP